jgi:peptide/nickel transport system substrate-binding protein
VLFSLTRVQSPSSLLRALLHSVVACTRIDDLTVEFRTREPDPILPQETTNWYIISKEWSQRHDAATPASLAGGQQNHATLHAMGTGPYRLVEREPDLRTVFEANPDWWGGDDGRPARAEFFSIANANTRVAALLAGDIDLALAVPPQDIAQISARPGFRMLRHPELRTIFLGMSQARDRLVRGAQAGQVNPFRDVRVREAIKLAIDEPLIASRIMRGAARPTDMLWGPGVGGYDPALDERPKADPDRARALLAEAGFSNGFAVTLDCPNDRYMMDEAICTAIPGMLSRIGIDVEPNIQPKARFLPAGLVAADRRCP